MEKSGLKWNKEVSTWMEKRGREWKRGLEWKKRSWMKKGLEMKKRGLKWKKEVSNEKRGLE